MRFRYNVLLLLLLVFVSCAKSKKVEFIIVQANDVYEIDAIENGNVGGMARLATLKKELEKEGKPVFLAHAGDFMSPSAVGNLQIDGEKVAGKHMVDLMNFLKFSWVTFGNHEFDLKEEELMHRLKESTFGWVCANAFYKKDSVTQVPFTYGTDNKVVPPHLLLTIPSESGKNYRVYILGLTIPTFQKPYVAIPNPLETAEKWLATYKDSADMLIALTHQDLEDDIALAKKLPAFALLMGGHEHDHKEERIGNTLITKADANLRTVYIHRVELNEGQAPKITSELKTLDSKVALDVETQKRVDEWDAKFAEAFKKDGFDTEEVLYTSAEPLEGREKMIRSAPSNLLGIITASMLAASVKSKIALVNGGSVRIDDQVKGPIRQYDVLRILPFGGAIVEVELKGSLLKQVLAAGESNVGKGGYLHFAGLEKNGDSYTHEGKALDDNAYYWVATSDFLLTGKERNLDFFTPANKGIRANLQPEANSLKQDIRKAFISYLRVLEKK